MKDKKTILVTGGAGFIGSELIRYLINSTIHFVVNVDKLTYSGNLQSLESIDNSQRYHFEKIDICDENQMVATPLKIIRKNKFEILVIEMKKIVEENNIKGIIVGNPINMDGSIGKSSQSAIDFCQNLSKNITIPITMWDERLSSEGSFKITKELGTNTSSKVKNLDKNAAAFILQGAIDFISN